MKLVKVEEQKVSAEEKEMLFNLKQREAKLLSNSAFFPKSLKGDIASAVIINDLAERQNISPLEIAQNIHIIHDKPSFSTTYLVARLNQSGLIKGALKTVISKDKQSCYATAIDSATGEVLEGMTVTMQIAKAEGWLSKKGSKWLTIPELMLRKRAQSFFIKEFYPQVMFGLQSREELEDIVEIDDSDITYPAENNSVDPNTLILENNPQPHRETTNEEKVLEILKKNGVSDEVSQDFIQKNKNNLDDLLSDEELIKDAAKELMQTVTIDVNDDIVIPDDKDFK